MSRRSVCITGCSIGGIGHALAIEFHAKGFRVFATSRNISSMESLVAIGIETLQLDVTDPASIKAARTLISDKTGGTLDVLVNNAGIAYPYAAADFSMERVKQLYDVNLFGAMRMVQEFIPLMIESDDARIIQIGSLAALMPVPFNSAYNSVKAALHSFGDTIHVELAPFNIKVITVAAGNVETNIMKPETLPPDSVYQPINTEYQTDRLGKFQDGAMPREDFARKVVSESLKERPSAWFWIGKNSSKCWAISTFLGRKAFDSLLSDMFGMTKMAKIHAEHQQKGKS